MQNMDHLTEQYRLRDFDVDWNQRLTAGAFLRLAQQLATEHCDRLGMDDAFYQKERAVFLMAKAAVHFDRVPVRGEVLTLTTLPETAHRAVYKRVLLAQDEQGKTIGIADSRWILVDTETKHILRHPPKGFSRLPFADRVEYELDLSIAAPEELRACGSLRAEYSLCDRNMHLNNTRYADAAANALPSGLLKSASVKDLVIRYHNELPAGETAFLEQGRTAEGGWYLRGTREGSKCFEARLLLG